MEPSTKDCAASKQSRIAWIALALVVAGWVLPLLYVLITGEHRLKDSPVLILSVLLWVIGISLSIQALRHWPGRIAFGLACLVPIGALVVYLYEATRPDPLQPLDADPPVQAVEGG